jgi:3-methyladenine DNA glycosylase AlkD
MCLDEALKALKDRADPESVSGMRRFGVDGQVVWGVRVPEIRKIARQFAPDHALALALWDSGVHEARLMATLVDDPGQVTDAQLEKWVGEVDSWDLCDGLCTNLIRHTPFALEKIHAWVRRPEEYIRRAGFVMMAVLAVHEKGEPDSYFRAFFPLIREGALDNRNFVKKAVNWALRQIGKRNPNLRAEAWAMAQSLLSLDSRSASWIAHDALREFDAIEEKETQ